VWFDAIRQALTFISFQENLEEDEMPSRAIWLDAEKLEEHFAAVKVRRKEKVSGSSSEIEDPVQNPAAKDLVVGG
jgi:hypothetical protein